MISRHWRCVVKTAEADRYVAYLRTEMFPKMANIAGFRDATILRRPTSGGIEFRILTTWASIESIKGFTGEDVTAAVVHERAQAMMVTYDKRADHYEVVE